MIKIDKSVIFNKVSGSSLIESYGQDSGGLVLEFKDGSKYRYTDVDATTVKNFVSASSKGKFFSTNIKGKFTANKAE